MQTKNCDEKVGLPQKQSILNYFLKQNDFQTNSLKIKCIPFIFIIIVVKILC